MKHHKYNFIQLFTYRCAYFVSLSFKYLKITPNQITLASLILNFISCYFLLFNKIYYFLILWYVSHFLDYCDGTLARITNNKTKILLRLDHYSDLIKMSITFLSVALFYSTMTIWIFNTFFILIFFLSQILSIDYSTRLKFKSLKKPIQIFEKQVILKNIYNIFFTFDGHTLFLVGFMTLSENFAIIIYSYLILLSLKSCFTPLKYLINNYRE